MQKDEKPGQIKTDACRGFGTAAGWCIRPEAASIALPAEKNILHTKMPLTIAFAG